MFAAFFAVVLVANVALVLEARRSFNGLAEDNAYEKGLAYNDRLARNEKQRQEGWSGAVAYDLPTRRFTVILSDRNGPVTDARARLDLIRPVRRGEDMSVDLSPLSAPGTYGAALPGVKPGQWDARVTAERNGQVFETQTRIVIPE